MGPRGATCRSACPVLHHSESGPLGLSVRGFGATGSASGPTACPFRLTLRQSRSLGPQGLLVVRLPAPFVSHSASLGPATATRVLSAPEPVSAPPMGLDVCFFLSTWCLTSLPFDFLSVLVVRGGAVCLPTLPSWFSQTIVFLFSFNFILYYYITSFICLLYFSSMPSLSIGRLLKSFLLYLIILL